MARKDNYDVTFNYYSMSDSIFSFYDNVDNNYSSCKRDKFESGICIE